MKRLSKYGILSVLLCCSLSLRCHKALTGGDELVPPETCIVEVDAPSGARILMDNRDYGSQRRFEFRPLSSGLGLPVRSFPGKGKISVSHDGIKLVTSFGNEVWDIRTGNRISKLEDFPAFAVAMSGDGKFVVKGNSFLTAEKETAVLFRVDSGRIVHRFRGHKRPVSAVAISGDGSQVVTAAQDDMLRIWDTSTGRLKREIESPRMLEGKIRSWFIFLGMDTPLDSVTILFR